MESEFAVKAETHEGAVMTLRRGFPTRGKAEDHPVTMALWKRVWIEKLPVAKPAPPQPALPPLPWDWVAAGSADGRGQFHAYLVDATGRKIAAIWGRDGEKQIIADHILRAVNSSKD